MDERLSKALEFSNFLETQNNQKRIFFTQYKEDLIFYANGHKITVSQQLISFCRSCVLSNETSTWILDDNDIPMYVADLEQFTHSIYKVYADASKKYLDAYETIKTQRSVQGLVDL